MHPILLKLAESKANGPSAVRRQWVWLGLIALVGLTLWVRLANPTGWLGSDDAAYHAAAEHLVEGVPIQRLHHQYSRLAVILPVAGSITLLGDSPTAVWAPMLVGSVMCVLLVAVVGWTLWGWWAGIPAAVVVSLLPYFRILSTAAYPDVFACLWSTAAILMALLAVRKSGWIRVLLLFGCGLSVGLAVSAKVFAAPVVIPIVYSILLASIHSVVDAHRFGIRLKNLATIVLGGIAFIILEGLFFHYSAGDFFYTLRAHLQATGAENTESAAVSGSFGTLAWDRLTILFRIGTSGWGMLGLLFWPVMIGCLFFGPGRLMAIWGLAVYLGVAFMPVGFEGGSVKVNPVFHGRHILTACIPFALCLSFLAGQICFQLFATAQQWLRRSAEINADENGSGNQILVRVRPFVATALIGVTLGAAYVDRHQLNGFRDRETSRIGRAISQLVTSADWGDDRLIFVPASIYWRFRILFPTELRERLRVAVDDASPEWWRYVSTDIASRRASLPEPGGSFLLATPKQLTGGLEHWDYGVGLPGPELNQWQRENPLAVAVRGANLAIVLVEGAAEARQALSSPRAIAALIGPDEAYYAGRRDARGESSELRQITQQVQ